jgi:hypothetical protein
MSNDAERITLPSGASYPSAILPLTSQEQSLLDTYASIKSHEKEASRLKAEEAKRRLEEADERYRAKIKERGDAEDVTTVVEEEDSEDEESKRRRIQREREISQLRRDVEAARTAKQDEETKQKAKREKEEALRKQLLGEPSSTAAVQKKRPHVDNEDEDFESDQDYQETTTTTFTGPSIKKKRPNSGWDDFQPQPSLIANIDRDSTPIHDFSKKLHMSSTSLDGTILFPKEGIQPWTPPLKPRDFTDGHLELELHNFDPNPLGGGNNTVAVKFHAPEESLRFSVNIARENNNGYQDILFHFNPRHFQRGGQLVSV